MAQEKSTLSHCLHDSSMQISKGTESMSQSLIKSPLDTKQIYCRIPLSENDVAETSKDSNIKGKGGLASAIEKCLKILDDCKIETFEECKWYLKILHKNDTSTGNYNKERDNYLITVELCEINLPETEFSSVDANIEFEVYFMLFSKITNTANENTDHKLNETHARKFFLDMTLRVEKDLTKLEFPHLPEGSNGKPFKTFYQLNKELSSGSFGTVFLSTHRATGKIVAVKAINRTKFTISQELNTYREVVNLSFLNCHPSIIRFIDFFEEDKWYMVVMEFLEGGSLFDRMGCKEFYCENDVRDITRELLDGVRYMHDNKIAHLDLNSKNLLLKSTDFDTGLKICDFGFSERVVKPKCLTKQKGTPFFVAPEILLGKCYDESADNWSIGVIVYSLLFGVLPFEDTSKRKLYAKVIKGKYDFPSTPSNIVSDQGKEFLRGLLVTDPNKRWTTSDALASTWLNMDSGPLRRNSLVDSRDHLKTFNAKLKVKAAMFAVNFVTHLSYPIKELDISTALDTTTDEAEVAGEKE